MTNRLIAAGALGLAVHLLSVLPAAAQGQDCNLDHNAEIVASLDQTLRETILHRVKGQLEQHAANANNIDRHQRGAVKSALPDIQRSRQYQSLSDEDQARFDRVWGALETYADNRTSGSAGANLVDLLERGALATPSGRTLLQNLDAYLQRDAGIETHWPPHASDVVILLANDAQLDRVRTTGKMPGELNAKTPAQLQQIAQQVVDDVDDALTAQNRPEAFFANAVAWWSDLITGEETGVTAVRKESKIGEMGSGQTPDDRLWAMGNAINLGNVATKHGWGQCQEHAATTSTRLHNLGVAGVEVMGRAGNPDGSSTHAFVVVGRTVGSDPNDPATWGDNALIVDAWGDDVFTAAELHADPSLLPGAGDIQDRFRWPDP